MDKKYQQDLDRFFDALIDFLNNYTKSKFLSECIFKKYISFYYGNLITNFFSNLSQKNVAEYKLPKGKIGKIKKDYVFIRKDVNVVLGVSDLRKTIDDRYYKQFKNKIRKNYPEFMVVIEHIETAANYRNFWKDLRNKKKRLGVAGKISRDLNDMFMTSIVEGFIKHKGGFPSSSALSKNMRKIILGSVTSYCDIVMKQLSKTSAAMLQEQQRTNKFYDRRRYERWNVPIDLLECLIRVSFESGASHREKLLTNPACKSYPYKLEAIVKIHARAVQIANEILVLLKTGYPDGANARWRSIHELAVISFFLKDSPDEVSQRYLEHESIRIYKDGQDYKTYCKKLGYSPLGRQTHAKLAHIKRKLCAKYKDRFQDEYGWIPSSILHTRNFRELEKHVKLDSLHPFYNLSCSAVHGGSRGFYRLGLMKQNVVLHVGPSNYGLADPLQNAASSLGHVTVCLLNLEPDFDSLTQMQILRKYIIDITEHAVKVQKEIEKDEALLKKKANRAMAT